VPFVIGKLRHGGRQQAVEHQSRAQRIASRSNRPGVFQNLLETSRESIERAEVAKVA